MIRVLGTASPGEVRAVAVDAAGILDVALERPGTPDGVGDLHRGRVTARVPALAGCFVALDGADGFLPDTEGGAGATVGDAVVVRVTRAAQGGKGPRLSARVPDADRAFPAAGPPALLRRGPGAVARLAALHPAAAVAVDDMLLLAALRPDLGARVSFAAEALDADTEAALDALGEQDAVLPGGARLTVTPTPALTAIDMDLGSAASGARGGKTAAHLDANRAALPALARQIRARNLSGGIVVDLAGLSPKRRAVLGPDLDAALAADPLAPRFLGFSALGFAEILRPRVHPPLHELLAGPHAAGLAALRAVAREVAANAGRMPALRSAPAVAAALERDSAALADLARRAGQPLMLRPDPALAPLRWRLEF